MKSLTTDSCRIDCSFEPAEAAERRLQMSIAHQVTRFQAVLHIPKEKAIFD